MIKITRMYASDIAEHKIKIKELLTQSFQLSFPKQEVKESTILKRINSLKSYLKKEQAIVYGIVEKGCLNGFVWFFVTENLNVKRIHINQIVIDKSIRGKGLGNLLISAVEKYAEDKEIDEVELYVTKGNEQATQFYKNRNFKIERLLMVKQV